MHSLHEIVAVCATYICLFLRVFRYFHNRSLTIGTNIMKNEWSRPKPQTNCTYAKLFTSKLQLIWRFFYFEKKNQSIISVDIFKSNAVYIKITKIVYQSQSPLLLERGTKKVEVCEMYVWRAPSIRAILNFEIASICFIAKQIFFHNPNTFKRPMRSCKFQGP